jgi:hypothetical protein
VPIAVTFSARVVGQWRVFAEDGAAAINAISPASTKARVTPRTLQPCRAETHTHLPALLRGVAGILAVTVERARVRVAPGLRRVLGGRPVIAFDAVDDTAGVAAVVGPAEPV